MRFILLFGICFFQTLYAAIVIDTVTLKANEHPSEIEILFDMTYHYDLSTKPKGSDVHSCRIYDAKNKAHQQSKSFKIKSYELKRSMKIPYTKQKGTKRLLIECASIFQDKTINSKTFLNLKNPIKESKPNPVASTKKKQSQKSNYYKTHPPIIQIKKIKMVNVKKISYRNTSRKDFLVETSSRNYILRKEDLGSVTLIHISKKVRKALEKIANTPIKAQRTVKRQRIKLAL